MLLGPCSNFALIDSARVLRRCALQHVPERRQESTRFSRSIAPLTTGELVPHPAASMQSNVRTDHVLFAGAVPSLGLARATKRACVIIASGSQRERGRVDGGEGADERVFVFDVERLVVSALESHG